MPLKCAAPLFYQDAVNETAGQEDMRACPLNRPEAPGEASTQRKRISLRSSVAKGAFCPPVQICLWIIVATGSKRLVFGDAACFMKCCHIVGHGLAALLGCVTSVFTTNPTSSGITVSILNLFFILLLLSLPVTHVFSLSLSFSL